MISKDKTLEQFLNELSSDMPAPGGGGAAALAGAIGISLGNMVAALTIGKKKFADVEEEIKALSENALKVKDELISLIDEDEKGFLPLMDAYKLPANTEDEKEFKNNEIEKRSVDACKVPFKIMEKCGEALEITKVISEKGSKMAASDAACAAALLKAAINSAALNIYINTKYLKDRNVALELNEKADELINKYSSLSDDIYLTVLNTLK